MRKHAEMIKAWADNEDLVVFHKSSSGWGKVNPTWYEDATYFACLPQHAEECEHWLNGGSLQVETPIGMGAKWVDIVDYSDGCRDWRPEHFLMCRHSKHRIKTKKERRWVITNGESIKFIGDDESYPHTWQRIEIEVEV